MEAEQNKTEQHTHQVHQVHPAHHPEKHLTLPQKILYGMLIVLFILIIVLSIRAMKDRGLEGYNQCVQKKCDDKGQDYCQKTRELNNCCLGAGGQLGQNEQGLTCVFE